MATKKSPFHGLILSGFCMQVSLLYQAAVPLYEGLSVMAEDTHSEEMKKILLFMSEKLKMGFSFSETIKETGCFPSYAEEMIYLGEQTGTLDTVLNGLADYYEKETKLSENLRRTLTYPLMMMGMLFIILFVLFVKIMPVFTDVYEQLGARIPTFTQAAVKLGGFISGLALVFLASLILFTIFFKLLSLSGKEALGNTFISKLKKKSDISRMIAIRRFCSTLSITLSCGLRTDEGFSIAERIAEHPEIVIQIQKARKALLEGSTFYDAVRTNRLFHEFELQLIRVASRAGKLDQILSNIAEDYDEKISAKLDSLIARIEPVIVTVLAIAVGMVLLSVMLPLVGVLSAIG